ncbi:MAG: hypothetical protein ACXVBX_05095 [Flavisolibacter sp.]
MKDLLIVTADSMNIMEVFQDTLASCPGFTFDSLDNNTIRKSFHYKNFRQRTYNFFLKNTTGQNVKHTFYNSEIEKVIAGLDQYYKQILIIRPDLLSDHYLQLLRNRTNCFIAYYWDTIDIVPRKKDIVHYFDRILSFDPADCNKYGFEFQPNFYFYDHKQEKTKYQVYNLSTIDSRKKTIEELAFALEKGGLSYLLKGFNERRFKSNYIQYTHRITYKEMLAEAAYCDVVLDVAKPGQTGLTFRPFEALGLNKKLITTNGNIRDYEFFHPDNVMIVEPGRVHLELEFFRRPFRPIPGPVKSKYHIKQWLANVLDTRHVLAA